MPYGYLGQNQPNQTVSNSGVFSITDVAELQSQGKLGGSLELIAEETFTNSSTVENTSIQEDIYDVHMLYINAEGSTGINSGIQFYESGVLETANVYDYVHQFGTSAGSFAEGKSTSSNRIYTVNYGATYNTGLYIYFYNLNNSSVNSIMTYQGVQAFASSTTMFYGGGTLKQQSTVDGFRVYLNTGTITGEYKLYGVKQL